MDKFALASPKEVNIDVASLLAPSAVDHFVQEDRMQTVATLVSAVQDLMEELKISASTALDNRILGSLAIPSSNGTPVLQSTEVCILYVTSYRQPPAAELIFNMYCSYAAVSGVSYTSNPCTWYTSFEPRFVASVDFNLRSTTAVSGVSHTSKPCTPV